MSRQAFTYGVSNQIPANRRYPFIGARDPTRSMTTYYTGRPTGGVLVGGKGGGIMLSREMMIDMARLMKRGGKVPMDEPIAPHHQEFISDFFSNVIKQGYKILEENAHFGDPTLQKAYKAWARATTELGILAIQI